MQRNIFHFITAERFSVNVKSVRLFKKNKRSPKCFTKWDYVMGLFHWWLKSNLSTRKSNINRHKLERRRPLQRSEVCLSMLCRSAAATAIVFISGNTFEWMSDYYLSDYNFSLRKQLCCSCTSSPLNPLSCCVSVWSLSSYMSRLCSGFVFLELEMFG